MQAIDLTQGASLVDYTLFAFMALNLMIAGVSLLNHGVRKLRVAR